MRVVIVALILAVVLIACSPQGPTCAAPYIPNGETCCLDRDANGACDVAENSSVVAQEGLDCSLCPPNFVVEKQDVIVYRYVCMNGSIMEDETDCEARITSDAHLFTVLKDQDETFIKTFSSRAACRGLFKAAELHIETAKTPRNITVQIKEDPDGSFSDLFFLDGNKEVLDNKYAYIGLCDDPDCDLVTDGQIVTDGSFVVRARLQYTDDYVYTRERLIDPSPEGEFSSVKC